MFAKTASRLSIFLRRHISRDLKKYVERCITCQEFENVKKKKLTDPHIFETIIPRWVSLAAAFIVRLSKRRDVFVSFTACVD